MISKNSLTRRRFLHRAAAAGAAIVVPTIVPGSALGAAGRPAPSNRIAVGCIGVGGQGNGNLGGFLGDPRCQVVAVNDVDRRNLENTQRRVNESYNNKDCAIYRDFRELVARDDIDAISMATPDHWHAITAIASARSGKDIYGEKPFSHDLREGRAMVDGVSQYGRIWQTGSWQRSTGDFRFACELVRNGRIGKVHTVEVGLPTGSPGGNAPFTDPPPQLDYDFWCGPSPWAPYSADRTHWNWRWQMDYGGGQLMDWIGHHGDIAHWGMGWDNTGPIEVEGSGQYPETGIWDAATSYYFVAKYRGGVEMHLANGGNKGIRGGTKWIGADGRWVWVDRGGLEAGPESILRERIGPDEVQLFRSPGHHREFLDCVRSRRPTTAPAETAHRSASIGHLGQIAMLVGRRIRWDPDTETIQGDPSAARMLSTPMRAPWRL